MTEFEEIIGYTFKNRDLLRTALTHSSYANEHGSVCNERFEFLGDSVLSIVVSDYLFRRLRGNEGDLSKIRASLVCENALAVQARKIKLGEFLLIGHGEEISGSRDRASILSDAFEALLAAIYLDSDIETVRSLLLELMKDELEEALTRRTVKDYKTRLQEELQKKFHGRKTITYRVVGETGPDHDKCFSVEVMFDKKAAGSGEGHTKKAAEQNAARAALRRVLKDEAL